MQRIYVYHITKYQMSLITYPFSGVAPIAVDPGGDNSIIIVSGANDHISVADLHYAKHVITSAKVLVCQLEIPVEISLEALRIAKEAGVTTIFNPAPAQDDAVNAARTLLDHGAKTVILTLGERGSLLVTPDKIELVLAEVVKAVDTTGAGDSFIGSLAYFLGVGKPPTDAMHRPVKWGKERLKVWTKPASITQ